ncbi:MAG: DUF4916 domain-containing protein, partial [Actinobacteria bacterium]|nr:DUF4916 domain-containing protein [Actinomycetota bacterium]
RIGVRVAFEEEVLVRRPGLYGRRRGKAHQAGRRVRHLQHAAPAEGLESLRDALFRHLENDLGPMAFPQIPASPVPAQVAEYFPLPGISPYIDERQHAVSLVFVVPVTGSCNPRQDALEVSWMAPEDALSAGTLSELPGGRGRLLRQALSSVGC